MISLYVCCSFWDWEKGERLDYFYNGNPRYTRITAMEYLNGHDCSLLLTATGTHKHTHMHLYDCTQRCRQGCTVKEFLLRVQLCCSS